MAFFILFNYVSVFIMFYYGIVLTGQYEDIVQKLKLSKDTESSYDDIGKAGNYLNLVSMCSFFIISLSIALIARYLCCDDTYIGRRSAVRSLDVYNFN